MSDQSASGEPVALAERLILGDCLDVMADLPAECIDMAYIDPPFFTQQTWTGKAGSFEDRWASLDVYLAFMRERIAGLHRVLKSTGTLYVHCDSTAGHYLKLVVDEVFDVRRFLNQITWVRGVGLKKASRRFANAHDKILVHTKSDEYTFHDHGHTDLWDDIKTLGAMAKERVGYPTQKPVALLERIIGGSTDPGDVVLDGFCGSGTTLVAAKNLGRAYIGIDRSPDAIAAAAVRLGGDEQGTLDLGLAS